MKVIQMAVDADGEITILYDNGQLFQRGFSGAWYPIKLPHEEKDSEESKPE